MSGQLPTFLVVGAQKAGTTSLWLYLTAHPDVFLPPSKELDFFVEEFNWRRGRDWYEAQFADAGSARAVGEVSPSYSVHPVLAGVPERIAGLVPDVRLVYVVRDPVARMQSSYLHAVAVGREQRPVDRALLEDPRYLHASAYGTQVERYLECFDSDQLLVISSFELEHDPGAAIDSVLLHVGLEPGWRPPELDARAHRSEGKRVPRRLSGRAWRAAQGTRWGSWRWTTRLLSRPVDPTITKISPVVDTRLRDALAPDMRLLSRLAGIDVAQWGF